MQIVNALFKDHNEAQEAYNALMRHGIPEQELSLLVRSNRSEIKKELSHHKNSRGIMAGTAAGAGLGALAGLAALAIPGFAELEVTGWLAALLGGGLAGSALGAAAGNISQIMRKAGVSEKDAEYFYRAVKEGAVLLIARVEDKEASTVRALLADYHSVNPVDYNSQLEGLKAHVDEANSPYMQAQREQAYRQTKSSAHHS